MNSESEQFMIGAFDVFDKITSDYVNINNRCIQMNNYFLISIIILSFIFMIWMSSCYQKLDNRISNYQKLDNRISKLETQINNLKPL